MYLVIYVDDGMIIGSHSNELKDVLNCLSCKLSTQPRKRFLGVEIISTPQWNLHPSQKVYRRYADEVWNV
jgi:hypothetical protein